MRPQSEIKFNVRGREIGGAMPLICLPLLAETEAAILSQAEELSALSPDLFEWRVDGFNEVSDGEACMRTLSALRERIGNIPLIFTLRSRREGGLSTMAGEERMGLILAAIASGSVDIVDFELSCGTADVRRVVAAAGNQGVGILLSYHDFEKTPAEETILGKLEEMEKAGAHIAKVAVMPNDETDVLALLGATLKARNGGTMKIPIVTMAMGAKGAVSRLAGGVFGSDITFAAGTVATAPGQIPAKPLREAMALLFNGDIT